MKGYCKNQDGVMIACLQWSFTYDEPKQEAQNLSHFEKNTIIYGYEPNLFYNTGITRSSEVLFLTRNLIFFFTKWKSHF
jgi:hypothetical protein